ncbi:hypothetical protein TIFTF001_018956 [Ficus carica]|uniref:Uncharacterized protein n=1 Tax=Ficus carica TaxID=3494 RepID=A0AA88D8G2_FICCA|nr:hypothetical protein TIFTF001_018956 [Ficus carica]
MAAQIDGQDEFLCRRPCLVSGGPKVVSDGRKNSPTSSRAPLTTLLAFVGRRMSRGRVLKDDSKHATVRVATTRRRESQHRTVRIVISRISTRNSEISVRIFGISTGAISGSGIVSSKYSVFLIDIDNTVVGEEDKVDDKHGRRSCDGRLLLVAHRAPATLRNRDSEASSWKRDLAGITMGITISFAIPTVARLRSASSWWRLRSTERRSRLLVMEQSRRR